LLRGLEEWAQDGFFDLRGQRDPRADEVLIGLDEKSLGKLNKPLLYLSLELAKVIAFTASQKAAAIGLDVMVPGKLNRRP
jgi:CHASE2 domain-containing sensor protein